MELLTAHFLFCGKRVIASQLMKVVNGKLCRCQQPKTGLMRKLNVSAKSRAGADFLGFSNQTN